MICNTPPHRQHRRKRVKGTWMQLRDPKLLAAYMEHEDFTQQRLAKFAECSRQFVYMLLHGERRGCTPLVAKRIEEALRVLPGTLFVERKSPTSKQRVSKKKTAA